MDKESTRMKAPDEYRRRRRWHSLALAVLCVGLAVGVSFALAGSDALPDYTRRSVSELQAAALKSLGGGGESNSNGFIVVGQIMVMSDRDLGARWLLVEQVMACCVMVEVALPLSGEVELEDKARVAVYGRLRSVGARPGSSLMRIAGRMIELGEADATFSVERVVPAEKVVHGDNVLDVIESDYVGGFRKLVQAAGLEEALRANEALTLFVPHDSALAGERTPGRDVDSSKLRHFILGHVTEGRIGKGDLLDREGLVMMNGDRHAVEWVNGKLHVGGARVIMANLSGHNGVAHIITPALQVSDPEWGTGPAVLLEAP